MRLLAVALILVPGLLHAQEPPVADEIATVEVPAPPPRDERGFTLAGGGGPAFGGMGLAVGYTFEPSETLHLFPYVGGGLGFIEVNAKTRLWEGAAAGFLTSLGRRHRAVLDVTFGSAKPQYLTFYGYQMVRHTWGPALLVGYALVTKTHFMVRAVIGPQLIVAPYSPQGARWSFASTVAAGYTF